LFYKILFLLHQNPDDGTEMVPKMSVSSCNQLTWLRAREDFIEFVFVVPVDCFLAERERGNPLCGGK
jgi:hypothetical protein